MSIKIDICISVTGVTELKKWTILSELNILCENNDDLQQNIDHINVLRVPL